MLNGFQFILLVAAEQDNMTVGPQNESGIPQERLLIGEASKVQRDW